MTTNYGLAGGNLDGAKHEELAADPAAYMRALARVPARQRAWNGSHRLPGVVLMAVPPAATPRQDDQERTYHQPTS